MGDGLAPTVVYVTMKLKLSPNFAELESGIIGLGRALSLSKKS